MEQALELEIFKTLVNNAENGYMIANGEGLILYTNKAYLRAVGRGKVMVGHYMQEYIECGDIKRSSLLMAIEQKRKASMITTVKDMDGMKKKVFVSSTPYFDDRGRVRMVVTQSRDRTELEALQDQIRQLETHLDKNRIQGSNTPDYGPGVVVVSDQMRRVMELASKIKDVSSTVLLLGESGVGKEIIAQYIRHCSAYKDKPFIAVNCSALSEQLLESELFGYVGGSFTGANKEGKKGIFEAAQGGILFLDEIGEISLSLQVKLLRALEDKAICRVGDYRRIPINVRIISATNKDLKQLVQEKKFREDLYYRLNVVSIQIPALRQRPDDILPLALFYLHRYNQMYAMDKHFSKGVLQRFQRYSWPGNIRELKNVVERLVVTSETNLIHESDLALHLENDRFEYVPNEDAFSVEVNDVVPLEYAVEELERRLLLLAKQKYKSSRKMAEHLQISRATVCRKLNKYNIEGEDGDCL